MYLTPQHTPLQHAATALDIRACYDGSMEYPNTQNSLCIFNAADRSAGKPCATMMMMSAVQCFLQNPAATERKISCPLHAFYTTHDIYDYLPD